MVNNTIPHLGTKEYLTSSEMAEFIGISKAYAARMRLVGNGPKYAKIGTKIAYRTDDIREWVCSRTRHSTSDTKAE